MLHLSELLQGLLQDIAYGDTLTELGVTAVLPIDKADLNGCSGIQQLEGNRVLLIRLYHIGETIIGLIIQGTLTSLNYTNKYIEHTIGVVNEYEGRTDDQALIIGIELEISIIIHLLIWYILHLYTTDKVFFRYRVWVLIGGPVELLRTYLIDLNVGYQLFLVLLIPESYRYDVGLLEGLSILILMRFNHIVLSYSLQQIYAIIYVLIAHDAQGVAGIVLNRKERHHIIILLAGCEGDRSPHLEALPGIYDGGVPKLQRILHRDRPNAREDQLVLVLTDLLYLGLIELLPPQLNRPVEDGEHLRGEVDVELCITQLNFLARSPNQLQVFLADDYVEFGEEIIVLY